MEFGLGEGIYRRGLSSCLCHDIRFIETEVADVPR